LSKRSDINLDMSLRDDFQEENPERVHLAEYLNKGIIDEWPEFINKNSDYGEIICRCEMVTRGEIIEAINRPVPAKSLDAIKRRTRAGGGRCQGGFCSPRVLSILADELGVSPVDINKKGQRSELLMAEAKELIREKAGVNNDS
ncbi:MAG TPA: (2Fe-2S)-binding protein, partial [Halanaerobiales bacterium]|nr:(2Fe-2S)-binding protein [Halanaerobiales bacterium]